MGAGARQHSWRANITATSKTAEPETRIKQARIVDPNAGTYRQLVEAPESCQVAVIHPGKPRNPDEHGLDELLKRAEPFL